MKDLVEYLVKELVSKPKEVKVSETKEGDGIIRLVLKVADEDMGIVIGKGGKTINAIRGIAKAAGTKLEKRVFLDIEDDGRE